MLINKLYFSLIFKLLIIFLLIGLSFVLYSSYKTYDLFNNTFRLSSEEVFVALEQKGVADCKKIADCNLLPGDVLIRRYITKKTWLPNKLFNPYYTHTAFYLGNGKIVEAVGFESNPQDEIRISSLYQSNWLNSNIDNFVIIRLNYSQKLPVVKNNLKSIALDPNYHFGFPKPGEKKVTCADFIFEQLLKEEVINSENIPHLITPDYLFWVLIKDQNSSIVGYNISI